MKVFISVPLLDLNEKPVLEGAAPVNLKDICANILGSYATQDMTGSAKLKQFDLGLRIAKASAEVELSAEDIVLLKDIVGKTHNPLVLGRLCEILEPRESE